jgi:YidC/Oxa1 family membrane protein insertase
MRTEVRFLVAIGLMLLVLVGTNILFPPAPPPPTSGPDTVEGAAPEPAGLPPLDTGAADTTTGSRADSTAVAADVVVAPGQEGPAQAPAAEPERQIAVEGPLYRYIFTNRGGRLLSAELLDFVSLRVGNGPVQLVPADAGGLTQRLVVGRDTLRLDELTFQVTPADGLVVAEGDAPADLTFSYEHPSGAFDVALTYTFDPNDYAMGVQGQVNGLDRPLLVIDLGDGMAFNEADSVAELSVMSYVGNHVNEGIRSTSMDDVEAARLEEGPYRWVALRSKYFVVGALAGDGSDGMDAHLGGILTSPLPGEGRARVAVTQPIPRDGAFQYRLYLGPQEYARLQSLGADLEEVNPYGWRFFRPIIRPIVGVILAILNFLHDTLNISYGWVLVVFGVAMRIVLWPLNQKAMRAQMRNMAVQPLLKEIQTKYKDNPERLQKEMMKLYKEYGFNPLAGCLPLLLPWPILIALFFVFQNTIELRGVPFYWLPDLSAKDPFYILPLFLAVSMFALQWINFRAMPEQGQNPQMKMMMWFMPPFFGFIFMQFPSGLNLYYATANIATIPQQLLIARERKKAAARGPVKRKTKD